MGTLYAQTTGHAQNSGSTDQDTANLSGSAATVSGSTVSLDGSPDLSALVTSGDNQSSIYIHDATNTTQKIFWITGFDNTAKTVTVSVAPSGVTSSVWKIGGRMIWSNANVEKTVRPGDTIIFNDSPAVSSVPIFGHTVSGTVAGGFIKLKGKAGVRPVLAVNNTWHVIGGDFIASRLWLENLELRQEGLSSSNPVIQGALSTHLVDVKISLGSNDGVSGSGMTLVNCEITGITGSAVVSGNGGAIVTGCYIHDIGGNGIQLNAGYNSLIALNNVIDSCGGRGIYHAGSTLAPSHTDFGIIMGNTVYGCTDSGLEVVDADTDIRIFCNNIFSENGSSAGTYNVEWPGGDARIFHGYNCLHHTGGGGGSNLSGLTPGTGSITSDPLFTNPSSGDFSLQASSPCRAAGFPGQLLGGNLGYLDMGAVQVQATGGGGGGTTARVIGG